MKRILTMAIIMIAACLSMGAQSKAATLNSKADNILGSYDAVQNGEVSKVKITKASDGTYTATVFWVANDKNKDGSKKLDDKNPDKSLRSVPCDKIVLMKGLKYNASSKMWTDTKIYDPTRGLKANVKVQFTEDGKLSLKGTILGISETAIWTKFE